MENGSELSDVLAHFSAGVPQGDPAGMSMLQRLEVALQRAASGPVDGPYPMARAALNAMREPTGAMIDAGDEADGSTVYDDRAGASVHWEAMIDAALREVPGVAKPMPQCEPMDPDEEGWSEWIHPLPGYLMQCCDCGLVHDMEFAIGETINKGGPFNDGEGEDGVVIFRARRHDPDAPQAPSPAKQAAC